MSKLAELAHADPAVTITESHDQLELSWLPATSTRLLIFSLGAVLAIGSTSLGLLLMPSFGLCILSTTPVAAALIASAITAKSYPKVMAPTGVVAALVGVLTLLLGLGGGLPVFIGLGVGMVLAGVVALLIWAQSAVPRGIRVSTTEIEFDSTFASGPVPLETIVRVEHREGAVWVDFEDGSFPFAHNLSPAIRDAMVEEIQKALTIRRGTMLEEKLPPDELLDLQRAAVPVDVQGRQR